MKINHKDTINYIENKLNIQLFDFQKDALRAIIENKNLFLPRGAGMSTILRSLGQYLIYLADSPESYDGGKYSQKDYDVIISINDVINCNPNYQLLNKNFLKKIQNKNKDIFIKDFDISNQFKE